MASGLRYSPSALVLKFSVTTDKKKTRWKFSLIPLGGYVKMFGDANAASTPAEGAAEMSEEDRAEAFPHKRLGQRTWIVAAGPLANYLFAIVLFTGLFATVGQSYTPAEVGNVLEGSAAEAAGFQPGDRVIAIDGRTIERFEDMQRYVFIRPELAMDVTILRDGQELDISVTPERVVIEDNLGNEQEIGRLGVSRGGLDFIQHDPLTAFWQACKEVVSLTLSTLEYIGKIITGTLGAQGAGGAHRDRPDFRSGRRQRIDCLDWFHGALVD